MGAPPKSGRLRGRRGPHQVMWEVDGYGSIGPSWIVSGDRSLDMISAVHKATLRGRLQPLEKSSSGYCEKKKHEQVCEQAVRLEHIEDHEQKKADIAES